MFCELKFNTESVWIWQTDSLFLDLQPEKASKCLKMQTKVAIFSNITKNFKDNAELFF